MARRSYIGSRRRGSVLAAPPALARLTTGGSSRGHTALAAAPSLSSRHEHEGRAPQPGVPAGPRDTQYPSASGYEYSAETYEGHPGLTPPAPARVQPRQGAFPSEQQLVSAPDYLSMIAPLGPLSGRGKAQTPLQQLLEGAGAALGGNPGGLVSALMGGPEATAQPLKVPTPPPAPRLTKGQVNRQLVQTFGRANIATGSGALRREPAVASISHSGAAANPADPLGAKTLGDVTAGQLAHARQAGTLQVSKRGVLSTPVNRGIQRGLLAAHENVLATNGLTGPLTPSQKQIATLVSKQLGGVLSPRTLAIQELQEQSGQHAIDREHEGNFNTLDIGYFDSGPGQLTQGPEWSSPASAAKATAEFFEGKRYGPGAGIPDILAEAKGKSVGEQLQIIGNSGWATSDYANELAATAPQVGLEHNPKAIASLQQAKQAASAAGINPTPWQGDVAGGGKDFTYVRADAKGMVQWLESAIGTQEGSAKQLNWASKLGLGSAEPWCANLVSNGLLRRGFSASEIPANPNSTEGFEVWGQEGKYATDVGTDLAKAKPGDVLAFSGAHTATYVGNGEMISGNFSNETERTPVSAGPAPLSMIIRPKYKGGKVKVADSGALSTSTTESVGGSSSSEGLATGGPVSPGVAGAGSVLGAQRASVAPAMIAAPGYAEGLGPATPNVAAGTTEGEELLRTLTEPPSGAVLR